MEKVSIREVEPDSSREDVDRRALSGLLNTSDVAINQYVLGPGDRFSGSLHAHMDQEEVFIVVEGEATFETKNGEVVVEEDEVIRFAPGEFQFGRNDGEDDLVAFALGAPRDSEDVRISRIVTMENKDITCPECGHDNMRISRTEAVDFVCPDCSVEMNVE